MAARHSEQQLQADRQEGEEEPLYVADHRGFPALFEIPEREQRPQMDPAVGAGPVGTDLSSADPALIQELEEEGGIITRASDGSIRGVLYPESEVHWYGASAALELSALRRQTTGSQGGDSQRVDETLTPE